MSNRRSHSEPGHAKHNRSARTGAWEGTIGDRSERAHRQIMTTYSELIPIASKLPARVSGPLRLAVAAYLARFKGSSRDHTRSEERRVGKERRSRWSPYH